MSSPRAVLFDLDGVITDTADLHFRSWQRLTAERGIAFDRSVNEKLLGLGRPESLKVVLGDQWATTSEDQRSELLVRKNDYFLESVAALTPNDAFPGIQQLIDALLADGVRIAVASSSRNARVVLDQLQLRQRFAAIVDGNDVPKSKPAPDVFLEAARQLEVTPDRCVVLEDAANGVQAAQAANMFVIGIGPAQRVGAADLWVASHAEVTPALVLESLAADRN